jgi:pimeloyl-ACP methyl ester carboxylesterase
VARSLGGMSHRPSGNDVSWGEAGPATGPGVLLVHGIGVSGRYFAPLVHALSGTHHVTVPDLPGFGSSSRPRPALSIIEQAIALETALHLKDRTGLVVLGHSMGSQVATELAARNPGLARGLILIGPVTEPPAHPVRQFWRLMRDLPREPARINAVVLRDYVRGGVRSFASTLPRMLEYPLAERLSAVSAPLVLMRGEHDPISSLPFLHRLAAAAPGGARVVQIPGAAHVAMTVRPDLVADVCAGPWETAETGGPVSE